MADDDRTLAEQVEALTLCEEEIAPGVVIRFRDVPVTTLMASGVLPPILDAWREPGLAAKHDWDAWRRNYRAILADAMVDPPVWTGSPAEKPRTHILPSGLGRFEMRVLQRLLASSGLTEETAAAVRFRGEEPAGGARPGAGQEDGPDPGAGAPDAPGGVVAGVGPGAGRPA